MNLYSSLVRPLAFRLDPEAAHEAALSLIARGVFEREPVRDARLEQERFGARFPNPLGLAAGFDKNGLAIEQWEGLGFGFAEIGTVTAESQPGNAQPRLFRLPEDEALLNRLGFNNDGAHVVAGRLRAANAGIPIGINIGKSRNTDLKRAAADYAKSFRLLAPHAEYVVVNVSSPNTPGLRDLQDPESLREIVGTLKAMNAAKPLLLKIAPDLSSHEMDAIVEVVHEEKLSGIVAVNTTLSRDGLCKDPGQEGGLSGRPLRKRANEIMAHLAKSCDSEITLIGVGGIFTGEDLFERIASGAHLCQAYTGFVYVGPSMPIRAIERLLQLMMERGVETIQTLRGSALR